MRSVQRFTVISKVCSTAGVVDPDDPVLRVRGRVPLAGGHGRGRRRRRVQFVVQDHGHHRGGDRGACSTGVNATRLSVQGEIFSPGGFGFPFEGSATFIALLALLIRLILFC